MKLLILTRYGRLGASSRLRSLQFLPRFAEAGIACDAHPLFSDHDLAQRYAKGGYGLWNVVRAYVARLKVLLRSGRYDLVWIEKEALPWMPAWLEVGLLRDVPFVLDYDDAIFHVYDLHGSALVRRAFGSRIDSLMRRAAMVICGNAYLAQRAESAGARRVEVVPTVVDIDRYHWAAGSTQPRARRPGIVWIGSPSTVKYLAQISVSLRKLQDEYDFELHVIGAEMPASDIRNVTSLPWSEQTEAAMLAVCDIGVMPLDDGPWERGKCGYKLIQYMASGLPVVGSDVGVNSEIICDGENGFLARTPDDWVARLGMLLASPALCERFGRAGRQLVESEYCLQRVAPRLVALMNKAKDPV